VHRDVKPGNVIVEKRRGGEQAYLTDFGLTKQMDATSGVTATGRWVGTIDYASPEQIKGKQVDARSDVYSLGCVMFVALTGRLPFEREAEVAKLYAHINDPAPAPSSYVPGLTGELDPVVARALAKDPEERFPSAGDLGRAALAAVTGSAVAEPERTVATGEAAPLPPQDTPAAFPESPPGPTAPMTAPSAGAPEAPAGATMKSAPPTQPDAEREGRGGRARWVAGIAGAAVVAGLAALGVTQLGGGGNDNAGGGGGGAGKDGGAQTAGIQFEPFSGAKDFTVDVPKGWTTATNLIEHPLQNGVKKTELVKPDGNGNVQIVQEPPRPLDEVASKALKERHLDAQKGHFEITELTNQPVTLNGRDSRLFGYQWTEGAMGPATVFNYAFVDADSGWRTRAAIAGTNSTSTKQAKAISTEMASTLKPK
jgi:hypothetical protein